MKGIGAGDEVAVPALISDTVGDAVVAAGATPVTFGCLPDLTPSPECFAAVLSPTMKAVIVPHLFGMRADVTTFAEIAGERNLLLIEDCAHYVSDHPGPSGEGAVGDCAIYSFHSGKPLSLDWGGAMTLSQEFCSFAGEPRFPAMDEELDQLLYVGALAQRLIEDPEHLKHKHVSSIYALSRFGILQEKTAKRRGGIGNNMGNSATENPVGQFLAAAAQRQPIEELRELCLSLVGEPQMNLASKLGPTSKRILKMLVPCRLQNLVTGTGGSSLLDRLEDKCIMPGGFGERLIWEQYRHFLRERQSVARSRIATIYVEGLDPKKFLFPPSVDLAAHWLVFPVVMRDPRRHDRLETESAQKLQIDIAPWMWPVALHDVPRLRRKVRVGKGSSRVSFLVAGLFNLPVHAQMNERQAERLVTFLNGNS
jgi:dTDP-4-amino-4,6-dideoxygalactose transaminase